MTQILEESYDAITVINFPLSTNHPTAIPSAFKLHPAFPNPFNPTAEIRFEIPKGSQVKITVYNITGRIVMKKDLGFKPSGFHRYILGPKGWASGTYIIQVDALPSILNQRITYLK